MAETSLIYKIMGERALIQNIIEETDKREGIFQTNESKGFDFVEPISEKMLHSLESEMGEIPRLNIKNPILFLAQQINCSSLNYQGRSNGIHIFTGEIEYEDYMVISDFNNFTEFNLYARQLKRAGFEIYPINRGAFRLN